MIIIYPGVASKFCDVLEIIASQYCFFICQVSYIENLNSLHETLHGGSELEGMTSLDKKHQLFASTGAIKFPVDQTEAWKEKVSD